MPYPAAPVTIVEPDAVDTSDDAYWLRISIISIPEAGWQRVDIAANDSSGDRIDGSVTHIEVD